MVLRAKRGVFRGETCLKSKRMLTERHNKSKNINIRYTSIFYFAENSVHNICKEFSACN